jgi:TonB family protein
MLGRWRSRCIVLIFTGCALLSGAQDAIQVDSATLNEHVDRRVQPIYPPMAWAAHVDGTVLLEIRIDVSGKVESAKILKGPLMLQQAALDGVKHWTFRPFDNAGVPAPTVGEIAINFVRHEDRYLASADDGGSGEKSIAKHLMSALNKCTSAIRAGKDSAAAVTICEEAAKTAETFCPDCRYVERRMAFVYAATAFSNAKDLRSASTWADKAVAVVKLGHDDASGSGSAYSTRGMIEAMEGNLPPADQDLAVAEDFGRIQLAMTSWQTSERRKEYAHSLAQDLRLHAKVLQAMNNPKEAQDKLDEAAKYD